MTDKEFEKKMLDAIGRKLAVEKMKADTGVTTDELWEELKKWALNNAKRDD